MSLERGRLFRKRKRSHQPRTSKQAPLPVSKGKLLWAAVAFRERRLSPVPVQTWGGPALVQKCQGSAQTRCRCGGFRLALLGKLLRVVRDIAEQPLVLVPSTVCNHSRPPASISSALSAVRNVRDHCRKKTRPRGDHERRTTQGSASTVRVITRRALPRRWRVEAPRMPAWRHRTIGTSPVPISSSSPDTCADRPQRLTRPALQYVSWLIVFA